MGEDFVRKTERSYRRSRQHAITTQLITPPLLQPREHQRTSYPCRLTTNGYPLQKTGRYYVHRSDDRSIHVLDEHCVIGTVEGEPRDDLNAYLDTQHPGDAFITIRPTNLDEGYLDFMIISEKEEDE